MLIPSTISLTLLVLRSNDLNAMRDFYQAIGLTFAEEQHGSGPKHLSTRLGDVVLEIYPRRGTAHSTSIRLGFRVDSVDRLHKKGVTIIEPPHDSPW